jgi:hypothetical protein
VLRDDGGGDARLMNVSPTAGAIGARRAAEVLLTLSALGEIVVGAVALAYPQIVALLMDATLDARGLLVARMLGSAALALGVTWWMARGDAARLSRCAAGYLVYNLGVGALFAVAALGLGGPSCRGSCASFTWRARLSARPWPWAGSPPADTAVEDREYHVPLQFT